MNIREISKLNFIINNKKSIILNGWLVIIDSGLYLLDEKIAEPYEKTEKVEILNNEIVFSVRDSISPLGGGKSFVFHRVVVSCTVTSMEPLKVNVNRLLIKAENARKEYIKVDLSARAILNAKKLYGDSFLQARKIASDDWMDFV